jgi:predicted nucleic acid-binding Zn ribbon protein
VRYRVYSHTVDELFMKGDNPLFHTSHEVIIKNRTSTLKGNYMHLCEKCHTPLHEEGKYCSEQCQVLAEQTNEKCKQFGMPLFYPEAYQLPLKLNGD